MIRMERARIFTDWQRYYLSLSRARAVQVAGEHIKHLEDEMRRLAVFPQRMIHHTIKRDLEISHGMALGVHKQLLWWLTSRPSGGKVEGGGRE